MSKEQLETCIHCGMCLPVCPTYLVTGSEAESPRGRLHLMKAWVKDAIDDAALTRHLDPCLGCQACETACPSGVPYGEILFSAREELQHRTAFSVNRMLKRFSMAFILPNPGLLHAMTWGLRHYQGSWLQQYLRYSEVLSLFPPLDQWERLLPKLCLPSPAIKPGMVFGDPAHPMVALFTGCVMDAFYRHVHWATIHALVANGYAVKIPEQTCCGALAHHAGHHDITFDLACENIRRMQHNPEEWKAVEWVVLNSAGCGTALAGYPQLFIEGDLMKESAQELSNKVIDVMDLLSRKPLAPFPSASHQPSCHLTYHAACHLHHAQRVQQQPLSVLTQLPGVTLTPLTDAAMCCGSAGVYNLEHPDLSEEILQMKVERLKQTQASTVVTGNPGCMLQLEHGLTQENLEMTVQHPVEIVARAYKTS